MESLLVTGCGGFVGGAVVAESAEIPVVHAQSRGPALTHRDNVLWHTFDPCDARILEFAFQQMKPDAVIHAAAIAGIDYCQAHQDEARRVNVALTGHIARLCREHGAKLVYVSTDNVFDGGQGAYTEDDEPRPINFYGATKLEAEDLVAELPTPWVVARTALVMGLPRLSAGNAFLARMIPTLERGETLGVPQNEIRSPIDAVTLARALLELASEDIEGVLHLAGNDILDRLELVRRIAAWLGLDPALAVANDPTDLPGRAPRPRDVSFNNARARALLDTPLLGVEDGMALVMERGDSA